MAGADRERRVLVLPSLFPLWVAGFAARFVLGSQKSVPGLLNELLGLSVTVGLGNPPADSRGFFRRRQGKNVKHRNGIHGQDRQQRPCLAFDLGQNTE